MRYKEPLKESEKAGIAKANKVGLAMGLLYATMFCAYGLAFWFGARMIIEDDYTGSRVNNSFFYDAKIDLDNFRNYNIISTN